MNQKILIDNSDYNSIQIWMQITNQIRSVVPSSENCDPFNIIDKRKIEYLFD